MLVLGSQCGLEFIESLFAFSRTDGTLTVFLLQRLVALCNSVECLLGCFCLFFHSESGVTLYRHLIFGIEVVAIADGIFRFRATLFDKVK